MARNVTGREEKREGESIREGAVRPASALAALHELQGQNRLDPDSIKGAPLVLRLTHSSRAGARRVPPAPPDTCPLLVYGSRCPSRVRPAACLPAALLEPWRG